MPNNDVTRQGGDPLTISVFTDGAFMTFGQKTASNMKKLFLSSSKVDPEGRPQRATYIDGPATQKGWFGLKKAFNALSGADMPDKAKEIYREVAEYYNPGSPINLYGSSRGGVAAAMAAKMIAKVGVLKLDDLSDEEVMQKIDKVYDLCFKDGVESPEAQKFTQENTHQISKGDVALGLLDAVPFKGVVRYFANKRVPEIVQALDDHNLISDKTDRLVHAVALQEGRREFDFNIFHVAENTGTEYIRKRFTGAHGSTIGGAANTVAFSDVAGKFLAKKFEDRHHFDPKLLKENFSEANPLAKPGFDFSPKALWWKLSKVFGFAKENVRNVCSPNEIHISTLVRAAIIPEYRPIELSCNNSWDELIAEKQHQIAQYIQEEMTQEQLFTAGQEGGEKTKELIAMYEQYPAGTMIAVVSPSVAMPNPS